MKWLTKFRLSAARDSQRPLPPSLCDAIARSDELQRLEKDATSMERALRNCSPRASAPPPGFHHAIMRAVRGAARPAAPVHAPALRHWLPASALAVLMLIAAWSVVRQGGMSSTPSASAHDGLAPAAAALELCQQVTQRMPAEMVAPLSEEWQRLNVDFDRAQQFLLASLP